MTEYSKPPGDTWLIHLLGATLLILSSIIFFIIDSLPGVDSPLWYLFLDIGVVYLLITAWWLGYKIYQWNKSQT